jgi:hypothetical protein
MQTGNFRDKNSERLYLVQGILAEPTDPVGCTVCCQTRYHTCRPTIAGAAGWRTCHSFTMRNIACLNLVWLQPWM